MNYIKIPVLSLACFGDGKIEEFQHVKQSRQEHNQAWHLYQGLSKRGFYIVHNLFLFNLLSTQFYHTN